MIFDWPARMRQMAEFVGFTDEDLELVRASSPVLLPRADELAAAVYEHFLSYPATARYFLTRDGEVNEPRLERRKHSLARWMRNSIEFKIDEQFPVFLLAVGVVHSNPPLPARFMTGTISFIQTQIASMLAEEIHDPVRALKTSAAWNKMLMLQLDILLAGYVTETPIPPRPDAPLMDDDGREIEQGITVTPESGRRNGSPHTQQEN